MLLIQCFTYTSDINVIYTTHTRSVISVNLMVKHIQFIDIKRYFQILYII